MFESSIPQNNNDLAAEKGPGCDVRHRFALSAVYNLPGLEAVWFARESHKELASLHGVSGSDRLPVHHFGVRRHSQLRHGVG